jgi:hypothetical protein
MQNASEAVKSIGSKIIKYLIEGFAVAVAAYYIPKRKMDIPEVVAIGVAAAAIFAVIDVLGPNMSDQVKTGMGLGIGAMLI